jgi:hypothetical protein
MSSIYFHHPIIYTFKKKSQALFKKGGKGVLKIAENDGK